MAGPPPGIEQVVRSQSRDHTDCPHCGRYVGPLELCPYCRRTHRKRPVIFWFKYLSPVVAIAGMLLLHQLGYSIGNPLVKLSDLGRTSNFAYIQLEGTVCDEPRFYAAGGTDDPTAGSMEFCLDDGTGQIRVKTYEDATRRIVRQQRVPMPGDRVRVTGNYQAKTHKSSLIVGSPEEIEIARAPVSAELTPAELAWAGRDDFPGQERVAVVGRVSFVYNDRDKGKYTAVMHLDAGDRQDERGKRRYLRVEIPWSRLELEGVILRGAMAWDGMPARDAQVRVTGTIKYVARGKHPGWRLYPAWARDIEVLDASGQAAAAGAR